MADSSDHIPSPKARWEPSSALLSDIIIIIIIATGGATAYVLWLYAIKLKSTSRMWMNLIHKHSELADRLEIFAKLFFECNSEGRKLNPWGSYQATKQLEFEHLLLVRPILHPKVNP